MARPRGARRKRRRSRYVLFFGLTGLCVYFAFSMLKVMDEARRLAEAYGFNFYVGISVASAISVVLGLLVLGALYLAHVDQIEDWLERLAERQPTWLRVIGRPAVAVIAVLVAGSALVWMHADVKPLPSVDPHATAPVQIERQLSTSSNEIPKLDSAAQVADSDSPPRDVCALSERFTTRELQACLDDIRKHPGRPGQGGVDIPTPKKRPTQPQSKPLNIVPVQPR